MILMITLVKKADFKWPETILNKMQIHFILLIIIQVF
jgi:hypothetical protein